MPIPLFKPFNLSGADWSRTHDSKRAPLGIRYLWRQKKNSRSRISRQVRMPVAAMITNIVPAAGQVVALLHLRRGPQAVAEGAVQGDRFLLQRHQHRRQHDAVETAGVEHSDLPKQQPLGAIARDPALHRAGRQADRIAQRLQRPAAIRLQQRQEPMVEPVERGGGSCCHARILRRRA